jgi:Lon protease-like protein
MEIEIPQIVPVMTLPETVLFPQAILPLYIFEPRYRHMLKDVLAGERLMAVACLDENSDQTEANDFEPLARTASIGVVRACQQNDDGTSNLVLQGLARISILGIEQEEPYRTIRISALETQVIDHPESYVQHRATIHNLIEEWNGFGGAVPERLLQYLESIEDPEVFIDLLAYTLCNEVPLKQSLLETLDTSQRYHTFSQWLARQNATLRLHRKMQGSLGDDAIGLN